MATPTGSGSRRTRSTEASTPEDQRDVPAAAAEDGVSSEQLRDAFAPGRDSRDPIEAAGPPALDSASASVPTASTETIGSSSGGRAEDAQPPRFARMVRETATTSIENQKGRAVRGLGAVAQAVRQATDGLRAQGQHGVSDYIGQAADRIDGLAKSLEQKDFDEIVEDLQSFGRRNPALFLAAAFGMGLCIARFMRSSGEGMIGRSPAER